jgi:valyl-tRNA synthetase
VEDLEAVATGGQPERTVLASQAIAAVRKAKTGAQLSMRADVLRVLVKAPKVDLVRLETVSDDLKAAGHIAEFVYQEDGDLKELSVSVDI